MVPAITGRRKEKLTRVELERSASEMVSSFVPARLMLVGFAVMIEGEGR